MLEAELEREGCGRYVVPNDVLLGVAKQNPSSGGSSGRNSSPTIPNERSLAAVITGANASGKTCYLKTAGVLCVLAQIGRCVDTGQPPTDPMTP